MKVAVFSDIHANYTALCTCIDYLDKRKERGQDPIEAVIFLGDYISDCPYPQRTMELLYELSLRYPCSWIRGNREEYLLAHQDNPKEKWEESSSTGSLLYTYNNLSRKELDFFRSLPITDVISFEGCKPLRICHGSPENTRELLLPDNKKPEEHLKKIKEAYLLSGHTHTQCEVREKGKVLWNPGALGMPFGVKGNTIFSILTAKEWESGWEWNCESSLECSCESSREWSCEWVVIPYDIETELKQFEESGLNRMAKIYALVTRLGLITGRNVLLETVTLAKKLAEQEGMENKNLTLPEKYWEEAARRLNIL